MKDIRSQYGDVVIVEFSGDGMAVLVGKGKFMSGREMTAEERAAKEARDAAFAAECVKPLENTHRIVQVWMKMHTSVRCFLWDGMITSLH